MPKLNNSKMHTIEIKSIKHFAIKYKNYNNWDMTKNKIHINKKYLWSANLRFRFKKVKENC